MCACPGTQLPQTAMDDTEDSYLLKEASQNPYLCIAQDPRYSIRGRVVSFLDKYKEKNCFPNANPSYELVECLPCLFRPLSYFLLDRLPVVRWLCRYSPRTLVSDAIAGVTVGLMVVPQALAYARIAGLPLEYGLYSSFMGVFVYMLFGTSKDITLGPTAILSLLTSSLIGAKVHDYPEDEVISLAVVLTLMSGLVQVLMGALNLGWLIDFIPLPVISGFTSAAAITIGMGQVKHLLGIQGTNITVRRTFIYNVYDTARYLPYWKPWDFVLGLCCILLVLFLRYFKAHNEKVRERLGFLMIPQRMAHKFLWLLCTARNAVVVVVAALIGFALKSVWPDDKDFPITLVDYRSDGTFLLPGVPNVTISNIEDLGAGIVVAALIGFLESIAIAKAFARQNNYKVNPSQELRALGLSNIVSSFFHSYPVTGSFSRTAVNNQSGVKTPAGGFYTGVIVLLALAFLSPYFDYIPSTALAAIIITAVVFMIDVRIILKIVRLRFFVDLIPLSVSFLGTLLLGIEYGVPIACGVSTLFLLYRQARTRHEVSRHKGVICLTFNGGWNYPGGEYIWKRIRLELDSKTDAESEVVKAVILDCSSMPEIDYTIVQGMTEECKTLRDRDVVVFVAGAQPRVLQVLENAKIAGLRFSLSIETALQMSAGYDGVGVSQCAVNQDIDD